MKLGRYRKAAVAVAGATVVGFVAYFGEAHPAVQTITAALTALGVYQVPNTNA